jgi:hypothetical protein
MSWYAQTEEAKKHIEECQGCEHDIWIEESAWAMVQYGKPIKEAKTEEISTEKATIMQETNKKPRTFNSHEEKVNYIKKLFKGE